MDMRFKRRELISYNNYTAIKKIYTEYNGDSEYGKSVLKIYKEFLKGLGIKNI